MKTAYTIFVISSVYSALAISCSSQVSENTRSQKETTNSGITLRTDSVLQFNVMVTSIFEDSKGNFWFGSHGDGLCMYDGNTYAYFKAGNGLPMGIDREFAPGLDWDDMRVINGGNQAGGVQEDKNGNIWCESAGEICKYDGSQFIPVALVGERELPKGEEWKEYLDYLWFGWGDGLGACVYDGNKLELIKFPIEDPRGWDRISELFIDSHGNMWLGTMDHGTHKYDGTSFGPVLSETEAGISRAIFEDASGRVWLPQNSQGKGMLYEENGIIHNFSKEYMVQFPDTKEEDLLTGAQTIEQNANGDLWFGMFGGGLFRYDGTETTHLMPNDDESLSLSKTIYKDRSGRLLFGLGEGSVYQCKGDSFVRFDQK